MNFVAFWKDLDFPHLRAHMFVFPIRCSRSLPGHQTDFFIIPAPPHPTHDNTHFIIHRRTSSLFANNNEHHYPHPTPPMITHISSATEDHHLSLQATTTIIIPTPPHPWYFTFHHPTHSTPPIQFIIYRRTSSLLAPPHMIKPLKLGSIITPLAKTKTQTNKKNKEPPNRRKNKQSNIQTSSQSKTSTTKHPKQTTSMQGFLRIKSESICGVAPSTQVFLLKTDFQSFFLSAFAPMKHSFRTVFGVWFPFLRSLYLNQALKIGCVPAKVWDLVLISPFLFIENQICTDFALSWSMAVVSVKKSDIGWFSLAGGVSTQNAIPLNGDWVRQVTPFAARKKNHQMKFKRDTSATEWSQSPMKVAVQPEKLQENLTELFRIVQVQAAENEQEPKNRKSSKRKLWAWVQRPSISVMNDSNQHQLESENRQRQSTLSQQSCDALHRTIHKARGLKARNLACTDGGSMGFDSSYFAFFSKPFLKFGSRSVSRLIFFLCEQVRKQEFVNPLQGKGKVQHLKK